MDNYLKKFFGMMGFTFGTFFNIAILGVLVYAAYTLTFAAFDFGREFADDAFADTYFAEARITIEEGANLRDVSLILEEHGIIRNALTFQIESMLMGNNQPFNGGTFSVNSNMSTNQINFTLRAVITPGNDIRITIPEGRSLREIAELLEANDIVSAAHFIEVANTGDFRYSFLQYVPSRENRLEGYLFPDTYFISENPTPEEIIHNMLVRFEEMFDADIRRRADEMGLTMDEVVIIASIIEKEVRLPEERALASAVIHNRLAINMPLQMCSTVVYAMGITRDRLLYSDLQFPSLHNTYLHRGLPIGPITNPGRASLEAAVNPADVNYLFFVLRGPDASDHFFTHDYNEHLRARARYNQPF